MELYTFCIKTETPFWSTLKNRKEIENLSHIYYVSISIIYQLLRSPERMSEVSVVGNRPITI